MRQPSVVNPRLEGRNKREEQFETLFSRAVFAIIICMSDTKNLAGPDNKPSSSKHHMKDINSRTANYKRMMKLLDQRKKELPLLQFKKGT